MSKKKPSQKRSPKPQKKATSNARLTYQNAKLIWEVSKIDDDSEWGWNQVDCPYFLKNIWKKMHHFETMTWSEILGQKHHSIAVSNIISSARRRLQELEHDDVEELVSFRLSGTQRLWAIRLEHVSFLLWWDPNHEICPSHKRHT
jgi:hypothetical protein